MENFFEPESEFDIEDLPQLWVIPIDNEPYPSTSVPVTKRVLEPDESPIFLSFRGSDTPPPLGFRPQLSRDNEAS